MKLILTMNIRKIFAVALAAAFAVTMHAQEAQDKAPAAKEKRKMQLQLVKKADLIDENDKLRAELDSLKMELEKYRMELEYTDSIAGEMMAMYEENEVKSAAGINPEDYTPEVSDSLLNIWYVHNRVNAEDISEYDMDSVRFQSNVSDEVYIERIRQMNSFITLPYNDIVKNLLTYLICKCTGLLYSSSVNKLVDLLELYDLACLDRLLHAWSATRLYTDDLCLRRHLLEI